MLALKVVCMLSLLAGAQPSYLGAALTPYAFPPAPVALPPVPVALPPPVLPLALPPASIFPGPGFGLPYAPGPAPLPYAPAPFSPFGFPPAIVKAPISFGYPAPVIKSYSLGYPAPVIKSFGHFDYHETPIIKAAPLAHYHLKAPLIKAHPSSFGYHHDHHLFA